MPKKNQPYYDGIIVKQPPIKKTKERKKGWSYIDGKVVIQAPPNETRNISQTCKKPKNQQKAVIAGEKLFLSYRDYLNSQQWMKLRRQALDRDGRRCRLCDSTEDLHVHHRRYPEARDEWSQDCVDALTTLCKICHYAFHDGRVK